MASEKTNIDQIIRELAEGNKLRTSVASLMPAAAIWSSPSQPGRWIVQYGGRSRQTRKRLRELEVENTRLKERSAKAELGRRCSRTTASEGAGDATPWAPCGDGTAGGAGTRHVASFVRFALDLEHLRPIGIRWHVVNRTRNNSSI